MYQKFMTALDGSPWSNQAIQATIALAEKIASSQVVGCHVYAAELHRTRFEEMEPGLPDQYQDEEKLSGLRDTHESLITDGMALISDSYLAPLVKKANELGIEIKGLAPEGRNYVRLIEQIRSYQPHLVIMGALGHGYVPESRLGSLTERTLIANHDADLLIIRQPLDFKSKPIVVGVDGSQSSYAAFQKTLELAKLLDAEIHAVAVYDPFFHVGVFRVIADALPEQDQQRFNFPAQEKLHDEIIDRGLEKLYREGLEKAAILAKKENIKIKMEVLAGKVFPQIHHYAQSHNAGLIVMGKYGLHHETDSLVGSNTHQLARLTETNLLVVQPATQNIEVPTIQEKQEGTEISWTPEAKERLKRIPGFARGMAKKTIESRARELGLTEINADFVGSMSSHKGRG